MNTTPLIGLYDTPSVPHIPRFVPQEHFKLKSEGGIYASMCENFMEWFVRPNRVECLDVDTKLYRGALKDFGAHPEIIERLGGVAKACVGLAAVHRLAELPGWNVFYVIQPGELTSGGDAFQYGLSCLMRTRSSRADMAVFSKVFKEDVLRVDQCDYVVRAVCTLSTEKGVHVQALHVREENQRCRPGDLVYSRTPFRTA